MGNKIILALFLMLSGCGNLKNNEITSPDQNHKIIKQNQCNEILKNELELGEGQIEELIVQLKKEYEKNKNSLSFYDYSNCLDLKYSILCDYKICHVKEKI